MSKKLPKNAGTNPKYVKLYRSIPCLSKAAISNRFVAATARISDMLFKNLLAPDPWGNLMRESRVAEMMKEKKITRKAALKILAAERRAWNKHYDSPLGQAERRIKELERHLELIKEVIADPNYLDKFD